MHAVIGILMALRSVDKNKSSTIDSGQVVDVALYESMFNLLEAVVPEYSGAGVVRQPSGTTVTGIVPTNTYACADGKFIVIGGNGDSIFARLMQAIGRSDLAEDQRFKSNVDRVNHEQEIDDLLSEWCAQRGLDEAMAVLESKRVPCGPVYSVEDMLRDDHFKARGLFESVEINGETLTIPALMPKITESPGGTDWPGPELASHTDEILADLGLHQDEITKLKLTGVVADAN